MRKKVKTDGGAIANFEDYGAIANLQDDYDVVADFELVFATNFGVSTWNRDVVKNAPSNFIMGSCTVVDCENGKPAIYTKIYAENQAVNFPKDSLRLTWNRSLYRPNTWIAPLNDDEARFWKSGRSRPDWLVPVAYTYIKEINLMADGVWYKIPDIWLAMVRDKDTNFYNYLTIYSNWMDYKWIVASSYGDHNTTQLNASIEVYGYEQGDTSNPVVLKLEVAQVADVKQQHIALFSVKKVRDLVFVGPVAFVDEFNYKLARARVNNGWSSVQLNNFIIDPTYDSKAIGPNGYLTVHPYTSTLNACSNSVIDGSVASSGEKDYVNVVTLENFTDMPVVMKTSDYTHAVTESFTLTVAEALKVAATWSNKTTIKVSAKLPDTTTGTESTTEKSFTLGIDSTTTNTNSWTTTDVKTFTVSGQTINMPAKTAVMYQVQWWLAKISGRMRSVFPLDTPPTASLVIMTPISVSKPAAVNLNMKAIAKELGLVSILDKADVHGVTTEGSYTAAEFVFTSNVGVMANYQITPLKLPPPLPAPVHITSLEVKDHTVMFGFNIPGDVAWPSYTSITLVYDTYSKVINKSDLNWNGISGLGQFTVDTSGVYNLSIVVGTTAGKSVKSNEFWFTIR